MKIKEITEKIDIVVVQGEKDQHDYLMEFRPQVVLDASIFKKNSVQLIVEQDISNWSMDQLSRVCHNLTGFVQYYNNYVEHETILRIVQQNRNLRTLQLNSYLTEEQTDSIIKECSNLESFSIRGATRDSSLEHLVIRNPDLKRLWSRRNNSVTDNGLTMKVNQLKECKNLRLENCPGLTNEGLK